MQPIFPTSCTHTQITCAAVGLPVGSQSPSCLWLCCSDGFGGQVCILDLHQSTQPQVVANITVSNTPILSAAAIPTKVGTGSVSKRLEATEEEESPRELEESLGPTISITSVTSSESKDSSNSTGSHDSHADVSRTSSISSVDDVIIPLKSESDVGSKNGNESVLQNKHGSCEKLPQGRGPDVVEESLNAMSKNQRQTCGRQPPLQALKSIHGFRRVRSNSAPSFPDPQTIAQEVARNKQPSPLINSASGQDRLPPKRSESTSRLWSPLSLLHSDLDVEGSGRDHCMWLGTEDRKILIYSAGCNLRSRSNREMITLPAPVHCIR